MVKFIVLIMANDRSRAILLMQKWSQSNSLLVVTLAGLLLRLSCPFWVECDCKVARLQQGERYLVDRVVFQDGKLAYQIREKVYLSRYFRLV